MADMAGRPGHLITTEMRLLQPSLRSSREQPGGSAHVEKGFERLSTDKILNLNNIWLFLGLKDAEF